MGEKNSKYVTVPKMRLGDIVIFRDFESEGYPAIINSGLSAGGFVNLVSFHKGNVTHHMLVSQGNGIGQFQYRELLTFKEDGNPDYSVTDEPKHEDCPDYDSAAGICDADSAACHVKGNKANCGEHHGKS